MEKADPGSRYGCCQLRSDRAEQSCPRQRTMWEQREIHAGRSRGSAFLADVHAKRESLALASNLEHWERACSARQRRNRRPVWHHDPDGERRRCATPQRQALTPTAPARRGSGSAPALARASTSQPHRRAEHSAKDALPFLGRRYYTTLICFDDRPSRRILLIPGPVRVATASARRRQQCLMPEA